jgi:hypothetical protein
MLDLINKSHVKEYAVEAARQHRPAWSPQRVSKTFLERINARVRSIILDEIGRHPSKGKTLK